MNIARLFAVLSVVTSFAVIGVTQASATTLADCQALLSSLRTHTVAAQSSFTNARDFNGALAKLDTAALKLNDGKTADAAQKLADFQTLLSSLANAPKPKLDPAVAQQLIAEAQEVINCINAIGTA